MSTSELKNPPSGSARTVDFHREAVLRVISYMKANLAAWDPDLSLDAFARRGFYSKSHLIDIFEVVTGTTPHQFLASLRIQRAKELLLHSTASATQIALEVGYQSFPTFSRTFSAYVGLSPLCFRKAPRFFKAFELAASATVFLARNHAPSSCNVLEGRVRVDSHASGLVFVGTFKSGIPQGRPDSGTVLHQPGSFRIRRPSTPTFHLLAALLPAQHLALSSAYTLSPSLVASRRITRPEDDSLELILRPVGETDPPLVVSLLALLQGRTESESRISSRG